MKLKLISFLFLMAFACPLLAQLNPYYHENAVFREEIKSVQLFREGFELSFPVLDLNEPDRLILKFDDLSNEVKNYYYTILHCDPDWNESFVMQNEYLEGFPDNPIEDYAHSFNTTFGYINYQLAIPNERVQLKLPGNYILLVYENQNKEELVFSRRFFITENSALIEGTVRRATRDAFKGENQEVSFSVLHPRLRINNPHDEVKVVIMQNGRWDNSVRNLKPLYIQDGRLI